MIDINKDWELQFKNDRDKNFSSMKECPKCYGKDISEELTYYSSTLHDDGRIWNECYYLGCCSKCNTYFKKTITDIYEAERKKSYWELNEKGDLKFDKNSKKTLTDNKVFPDKKSFLKGYKFFKKRKEKETFETRDFEDMRKEIDAGSWVVTVVTVAIFCILIYFLFTTGCSLLGSIGSSNKYEPTTGEVLEWFDKKDSSGNYVNRGEYNTKRSY